MERLKKCLPILFVAIELALYFIILFLNVEHLEIYCYLTVVFAFVFSLFYISNKKYNYLCMLGFMFTLIADFFLVVNGNAEYKGLAMTSFFIVQIMYAVYIYLSIENKKKFIIGFSIRLTLTLALIIITALVLKDATDYLAIVSIIYFVNLFCNIFDCILNFKKMHLLLIALVLFLLCDVVTGLSVADGLYFQIPATSIISKIIYYPFNLIWFFYVPSQVLIALNLYRRRQSEAF